MNTALTVTLADGMVKEYFPPPRSVRLSLPPFASVALRLSSFQPSSGVTVSVTLLPASAQLTEALTLPCSVLTTSMG